MKLRYCYMPAQTQKSKNLTLPSKEERMNTSTGLRTLAALFVGLLLLAGASWAGQNSDAAELLPLVDQPALPFFLEPVEPVPATSCDCEAQHLWCEEFCDQTLCPIASFTCNPFNCASTCRCATVGCA
jgi:hypothetical protein